MHDCANDVKKSSIIIVAQKYLAMNINRAVYRIIDMATIVMSYE